MPDHILADGSHESPDWGEFESALGFSGVDGEGDDAWCDAAMDEDECATYGLSPEAAAMVGSRSTAQRAVFDPGGSSAPHATGGGATYRHSQTFGISAPTALPQFEELSDFVTWLRSHFGIGGIVPECWALPEHWAIAEELLALHEDWSGAVCAKKNPDPGARAKWLGLLDAALERIARRWDRYGCAPRGGHQNPRQGVEVPWPENRSEG